MLNRPLSQSWRCLHKTASSIFCLMLSSIMLIYNPINIKPIYSPTFTSASSSSWALICGCRRDQIKELEYLADEIMINWVLCLPPPHSFLLTAFSPPSNFHVQILICHILPLLWLGFSFFSYRRNSIHLSERFFLIIRMLCYLMWLFLNCLEQDLYGQT